MNNVLKSCKHRELARTTWSTGSSNFYLLGHSSFAEISFIHPNGYKIIYVEIIIYAEYACLSFFVCKINQVSFNFTGI